MSHLVLHEADGELIDVTNYCSDACAREDGDYAGWYGCHEVEFTTLCAGCGVVIPSQDACEHQRDNIVVNRFWVDEPELCAHGNVIQGVMPI